MDGLEGYLTALRERCAELPDRRTGSNGRYTMADIGLAAVSVFFMQSPSFLAHQKALAEGPGRGRSNCHTLLGMTAIPSEQEFYPGTADTLNLVGNIMNIISLSLLLYISNFSKVSLIKIS